MSDREPSSEHSDQPQRRPARRRGPGRGAPRVAVRSWHCREHHPCPPLPAAGSRPPWPAAEPGPGGPAGLARRDGRDRAGVHSTHCGAAHLRLLPLGLRRRPGRARPWRGAWRCPAPHSCTAPAGPGPRAAAPLHSLDDRVTEKKITCACGGSPTAPSVGAATRCGRWTARHRCWSTRRRRSGSGSWSRWRAAGRAPGATRSTTLAASTSGQ